MRFNIKSFCTPTGTELPSEINGNPLLERRKSKRRWAKEEEEKKFFRFVCILCCHSLLSETITLVNTNTRLTNEPHDTLFVDFAYKLCTLLNLNPSV